MNFAGSQSILTHIKSKVLASTGHVEVLEHAERVSFSLRRKCKKREYKQRQQKVRPNGLKTRTRENEKKAKPLYRERGEPKSEGRAWEGELI